MDDTGRIRDILKNNKDRIFLAAIFTFLLFSMVHRLFYSPLGGDEWVEYNISQLSTKNGDLYREVLRNFQPPLYNYVMHFWLRISTSIHWFRFLNVILGFASGIMIYRTVSRISDKNTAGISVVMLACCYEWIYCIQECSEYALMLMFVFAAIMFYSDCCREFTYPRLLLMIGASVCAIYSQYGSVFVIVPLLAMFFFNTIFGRESEKKRKISIFVIYIVSLMVFALPLWVFFARRQSANHAITENTVSFELTWIRDLFWEPGNIICYFFNLDNLAMWKAFGLIISVFLITVSVWYIKRYPDKKFERGLIAIFWIGYFAHYFLTRAHIYAMIQPGESAGLYFRYSYFYIPVVCILIPVLIHALWVEIPSIRHKIIFAGGVCAACLFISFCAVMVNWHKTRDDEFAKIWADNNGWEDTTFLLGMAKYGFDYYVNQSDVYYDGIAANTFIWPDEQNMDVLPYRIMPLRFWVWGTGWNTDFWEVMTDMARHFGYDLTVYDDGKNGQGKLAYCAFEGEPERFNSETVRLYIVQADFEEDGKLTVQCHLADGDYFNESNFYKLTYTAYDEHGNPISSYNERIPLGTWVTGANYYCTIDVEKLNLGSNYVIGMNIIGDNGECLKEQDVPVMIEAGRISFD